MIYPTFMRQTPLKVIFIALGLLISDEVARAQSQAQDRVVMDQTLRAATGLMATSSELTPAKADDEKSRLLESEFGTQKIRPLTPKNPSMLIGIETGGFYTSNAVLAPFAEKSDWVGRAVLRAAWLPEITDHLSLLVSANYGLWRYSDLDFLDFDDIGGQAGFVWKSRAPLLPGQIPVFSAWAQYRYNRLTRPWEWEALLYETHFAEAGLRQAWGLGENATLWISGNAAVSVAGQPELFRRHEYSAQLGALWQLTPKIALTTLYRAALFDYVQGDRQDINHLLFAGVSWQVSSLLRADFYASGTHNDSNVPIFDYQVINLGLNAALTKMW
jgi:hypothetical protein